MQRLLIAANLFLDRPLIGYVPSSRQKRRKESLSSFRSIVDEAVNRQVDGVIIAGNLFNTPYPSPMAWQTVKDGAAILKRSGIPLLLLAGENDDGPLYQNQSLVEDLQLLTGGMSIEFLPGLNVSIGRQFPKGEGILLWQGKESPQSTTGILTLVPDLNWKKSDDNAILMLGSPLKLDFDAPDDPSISLVTWNHGPSDIQQIFLPDRVYASVRWDVEERGRDLASYLQERIDSELALRLLVYGAVEEALPIEALKRQYQSGFFHLSIIDQTNLSLKALSPSLLASDTFNKLISDALSNPEISPDDAKRYFRAWVLGQDAFKGGEKRAN
jgi:hypothetical protein